MDSCHLFSLRHVIHQPNDLGKVGRPVQVHILERILVGLHNTVESIDLRVKDVTVQREAVRGSVRGRRNLRAKSKGRDLFIGVVVLENVSHRFDSIQILVLLEVQVMKRVRLRRSSIGQSEVDRDAELNLAATEHVLQESVALVELWAQNVHFLCSWSAVATVQKELSCVLAELSEVERDVAQVGVLSSL